MSVNQMDGYTPNAPDTVAGLDLRDSCVRMVWGSPNRDTSFFCHGWRRFTTRERFQRYWRRHLWHLRPRVALAGHSDPLGVAAWLGQQCLCIDWPCPTDCNLEGEMNLWGIPKTFTRAFDMALSANLRIQHDRVLSDRWLELQMLHRALARATEDLRRLSTSLRGIPLSRSLPPPWTPLDNLPPCVEDPIQF